MSSKYSRENALEKATELFWDKGFVGSSMRDIQDALDMRPGSIYAAFGNKAGLFSEVIHHYTTSSLNNLQNAIEHKSPLTALQGLIEDMLTGENENHQVRQCLLFKSVTDFSNLEDSEKKQVASGIQRIEKAFADVLKRACDLEELPANYDCDAGAVWLQQQITGLRSYACVNNPIFSAKAEVERVIKLLPHV